MKHCSRSVLWVILVAALWSILICPEVRGDTDPYTERLRSGLDLLKDGLYNEAAHKFDAALDADLNAAPARDGLALSLLLAGKPEDAKDQFSQALEIDSKDPVSSVGIALADLSLGRIAEGRSRLETLRGNPVLPWVPSLLTYLDGIAGITPETPGNDLLTRGVYAGLWRAAPDKSELETIAAALKKNHFDDHPGLYVTYDISNPLTSEHEAKVYLKKRKPVTPGKIYSGQVVLSAQTGNRTDVRYVQFQIDGRLAGVTNTEPFRYVWDTSHHTNGIHTLIIHGYTASGEIVTSQTKTVHVYNENPDSLPSWESAELAEMAKDILALMTPVPSSKAIHYRLGVIYLNSGDRDAAAAALEYTVAIDPNYRDARRKLIEAYSPIQAVAPVWVGSKNKKAIAITFDDGPKSSETSMLLDILKMERVPATFFVVGKRVAIDPDLVKRMQEEGHLVANHSYGHPRMTALKPVDVERQIMRNMVMVREITGKKMGYFRSPGGHFSPMVFEILRRYGIWPVFWTADCYKMEGGSPEVMVDYALSHASSGGIILMHNGENTTLHALTPLIHGLKKRGYEFVTLEELTSQHSFSVKRTGHSLYQ